MTDFTDGQWHRLHRATPLFRGGLALLIIIGILFGNFNALAMEPMGHIAGVAAAVVGSLATIISSVLGWVLGQAYDGTVRPMAAGFAVLTALAGLSMFLAERYRRPHAGPSPTPPR